VNALDGGVSVLGTGRLAGHLVRGLHAAGVRVVQVWGRDADRADALAGEAPGAGGVTDPGRLSAAPALLLAAVRDDAVADLAARLEDAFAGTPAAERPALVHTAGALPLAALAAWRGPAGVAWPLQSFSAGRAVHWPSVPWCVEGPPAVLARLEALASALGGRAHVLDGGDRAVLHLAAVWASNFANFCFAEAADLARARGLDPRLLGPLVTETAARAAEGDPRRHQTGPALRGDRATMERHAAEQAADPLRAALYARLSEAIARRAEAGRGSSPEADPRADGPAEPGAPG
jgi:predicted short-subunit dehydrogenase-like oxidoreductase (DUF2520 family)